MPGQPLSVVTRDYHRIRPSMCVSYFISGYFRGKLELSGSLKHLMRYATTLTMAIDVRSKLEHYSL